MPFGPEILPLGIYPSEFMHKHINLGPSMFAVILFVMLKNGKHLCTHNQERMQLLKKMRETSMY